MDETIDNRQLSRPEVRNTESEAFESLAQGFFSIVDTSSKHATSTCSISQASSQAYAAAHCISLHFEPEADDGDATQKSREHRCSEERLQQ
jgi:hypothetical protein